MSRILVTALLAVAIMAFVLPSFTSFNVPAPGAAAAESQPAAPAAGAPSTPPEMQGLAALLVISGYSPTTALDGDAIQALATAGSMRRDKLPEGVGRYHVTGYLALPADNTGAQAGLLFLQCDPASDPAKVFAAVREDLNRPLDDIFRAKMDSYAMRARRAEQRQVEAQKRVEEIRDRMQSLRQQAIALDAFPEAIDQEIGKLREDRLKLRTELAGLQARYEAIVRHIEERSKKLAAAQEQEEVLKDLAKIVELRQAQLARVNQLREAVTVSESEVQEAELQLLTARADLAERRRQIAQQAGSDELGRLNAQLTDVRIAMAAAESQSKVIDLMLTNLGSVDVRNLVDQHARVSRELQSATAQQDLAAAEVSEARKLLDAMPAPSVTVIAREEKPK